MKCRACGFEIADKAIVCYRCGTPTADPAPRPVARRRRRRTWPLLVLVLLLLAVVLAIWLMGRMPGIG
jgi:peptidoglycan/LPS O-acetylase OafA/YrhL